MNKEEQLFTEAYQLQQKGQLPQAIALYQQLLSLNPQHIQALHFLGLLYAQSADMQTAILYLQQALILNPDNAVLLNNLANAYKKNHQLDKAEYYYQQAINVAPDYAQAQNNLGAIYALQNKYQQALHHYRHAVHAQPDFTAAHFNLGLLLLRNNQLKAAATQFCNVLTLNPDHLEAQFYNGVLALDAGNLDQAEQALQKVLLVDTDHVEALSNLGVIALKREQGQLAIDYFTKALARDNEHIESRNNLAATFMHYDRFENALMHYDVLLQKSPDNAEYLYNSGVAQMALGHLNEAILHFEHLLRLDSKHFASLNNLSAIYNRLGDKTRAQHLLQQALTVKPDDAASQHMLRALLEAGKPAKTCKEYPTNLFNNYALYYDKHMQEQLHYQLPAHIKVLLDEIISQPIVNALDLGCGTGLTGEVLRPFCQHLTGIDIAAKMLVQAKAKQVYNQLIEEDAIHYLAQNIKPFDLIVAADVLPYLGDLDELFLLVRQRITAFGYFIFSAEISVDKPWQLQGSARFSHSTEYLQELAKTHDFEWTISRLVTARTQEKQSVNVNLIALKAI